jgi:all-trans-retinol 13,14-reductase
LPNSKSKIFAETATAMTYMQYDEVRQWEKSTIGNRGNEYEEFKKYKAEKLIDNIEKQFPGFKDSIESYYTSTPLSMKAYTGTKNGSMYGILHNSNDPLKTKISPRTKIPNLLLSGQNVNFHGVLGVTVASVFTCTEMLGMEYLLEKINNA